MFKHNIMAYLYLQTIFEKRFWVKNNNYQINLNQQTFNLNNL